MASRDNRSRAATVPPTTPRTTDDSSQAHRRTTRQSTVRNTQRTPVPAIRSLPLETHRSIASAALVLLILLTLLAPTSQSVPNPSPFVTPHVDGSGIIAPGFTATAVEDAVFPYLTFVERQQGNLASTWPDAHGVINNDPNSLEGRRAIIGQLFGSTSGIETRVRDSGLESSPSQDKLEGVTFAYQQMANSGGERSNLGFNGLAIVDLVESLTTTDPQNLSFLERDAVTAFRNVAASDTKVWQYTYNWALASFLLGNYEATYQAMRSVASDPATKDFPLVRVWMGLAALRNGEPDEAINQFNSVINTKLDPAATENVRNSYNEALGLAEESLGDAQWARRDPATAYNTYMNTLIRGTSSTGLYRKWLRLGLQQHGYEQMLADMNTLLGQGLAPDLQGRIHHDRARLLSFLGRGDTAMSEYKLALDISQNDPPVLISYGQALLSQGDSNGALVQAEDAIRKLGKDPSAGDMVAVATSEVTSTTSLALHEEDQELLDAHLLRAGAWSTQNNSTAVNNLVANITNSAAGQPATVAGLLYLYGAYAYEAAANAATGDTAADYYGKASDTYKQAWDKLKDQPAGAQGRAASLTGQARTVALAKGKSAQDGLAVLKQGGYDPASISPKVSGDSDAPDILYAGALLLQKAGQQKEAINAFRVSAVLRNLHDAEDFLGVGRPLWMGNGTSVPAQALLQAGDAARQDPNVDPGMVVMRYKQAYGLDSALAPAWNNLGVWYSEKGNSAAARSYLELSGLASPNYALGNHNLATEAYQSGIGSFFTAEQAQGEAIKASGPQTLGWGYNLRYDERGPLPSPSSPPSDFVSKLGALVILLLLLAHTLVGRDRMTNRMGLIPTRGVIGRLAAIIDARVKSAVPWLLTPGSDNRSLLIVTAIPAVVGMFALAWGAGHGSWAVALLYLPVGLIVSGIAFAANELAQRAAARAHNASTLHHLWPVGVLLGIVSIPFGFVYGWQNVTRLQTNEPAQVETGRAGSRRGRTVEEVELARESLAEAAADSNELVTTPVSGTLGANTVGRLGLSPAARIIFAGAVANLLLGLLFALLYWLTGWPSLRLGLFASMLVLAFTSVSEPPADGWTLYRRNAPLWLALFIFASTVATLLALGLI
jgi:tetratricopeptide (TPR) repeat protein